MNSKWYWLARKAYQNIRFYIKKAIFRINQRNESSKRFSSFSTLVMRTLAIQVAINFVLIAILYSCDQFLLSVTAEFAQCQMLSTTIDLQESILVDIVIGGIGVAGVILGLYCSNIASVYSSKYTNAPETISSAFQRDVVTNRCIKQITGYIIFCVITLFGCLLNASFSYISTIALIFLTIRMIITFTITGNRTYLLSNTFNISDNLYPEVYSAIKRITTNKGFSGDPDFQNHYNKICSKQLKILKDIAIYNKDNPTNQNPAMLSFMNNNLALLAVYWEGKETIYYDSYWYGLESQYKKWHTATDIEVSIALNAGVSLQEVSTVKNRWWFEQDLLEVNNICIEKLCADRDLFTLYSYLFTVAQLSEKAMESDCLLQWTTHIFDLQEKILPVCIACAESDVKDTIMLAAAVADAFSGIYINVVVGINNYLRALNVDSILNRATEVFSYDQLKPDNRYYNNKPAELLYNCISVELELESKRLTPDWYIKQTIAYSVYQELNKVVTTVEMLYSNILSVGKKLTENKCYLQGATILSRVFELSSKTAITSAILENLFSKTSTLHFEPSVIWEECLLKNFEIQKNEVEKSVPPILVKCCGTVTLTHWKDREKYPDFLGFCYNHLCEYLVSAIEKDKFELFQAAYSDFLGLVLLYHEYVREDVVKIKEPHRQNAVFHIATAPLLEYAMISGLAIVWGEFTENASWRRLIESELDAFTKSNANPIEVLDRVSELLSVRNRHMHAIGNRDSVQIGWEQRITNSIRDKGLCCYEYKGFGTKVLKTESALLKAFFDSSFEDLGFLNSIEEVYLVACLNRYVSPDKRYKSKYNWEEDFYGADA